MGKEDLLCTNSGKVYQLTEYKEFLKKNQTWSTTCQQISEKQASLVVFKTVAINGVKTVLPTGASACLTVYDTIKGINHAISSTTTVSNISANYTINATTNYTFLFVSIYNGSERDAIMAYAGDEINVETTCVQPLTYKLGNITYPVNTTWSNTVQYYPDNYSDRSTKAVENFKAYYAGNKAVECHYIERGFSVKLLNNVTKSYRITLAADIFQ